MKYVSKTVLATLLMVALQGCDIAADVRIQGDPVNSGGNPLDPDNDFNIRAYFYTDRPVEGLRFICTGTAMTPVAGKTDEYGAFVCPRASRATFYVGDPNELSLGSVDLKIFGRRAPVADDGSADGEADARENVAITPLTLYGTTYTTTVGCSPDPRYCQVSNVFQLLHLLDTSVAGANVRDRLIISPAMHLAITSLAPTIVLNQTPDNFVSYATPIKEAADAALITQRSGGVALLPGPGLELETLVKSSVRAQRAGIYRYAPQILGFDPPDATTPTSAFRGTMAMLVGRNGQASGIGYSWETDFLLSQHYFDTMSLTPGTGATINPDGRLENFVFTSIENGDFTVTGRMVNDRLFGDVALLDPQDSNNYKIPYTYEDDPADVGQFTEGTIQDSVTLYRQLEGLPDVDMEILTAGYLPREFGLLYQDYPDGTLVTDVQRADFGYGGANQPLRFRILPNGDIVSVTYGYNCDQVDFSEVEDVNGQYRRGDGTPEAVIGQVGSVFQTVTTSGGTTVRKRYMTIALAVYDPGHPDYGFQFGTPALDGVPLDAVVIDIDNPAGPQLLNKTCDPAAADCTGYLEWFNTINFYNDVIEFLVVNDLPQDDPAAATYLRKPGYFGRVTQFFEFCP